MPKQKPTPFDFENEEMDGLDDAGEVVQPSAEAPAVEQAVGELFADEAVEPEVDDAMVAVKDRLQVAQYYDLLLNHHLFGGDESPAAVRVQKEIREHVRDRLSVLMGIKPEAQAVVAAKLPWSEAQITALTQVANKIVDGPSRSALKPAQPAVPTLTQVPGPKTEEPKTVTPVAIQKPKMAPVKKPTPQLPTPVRKPGSPPPRPATAPQRAPNSAPAQQTSGAIADSRIPPQYKDDPTLTFRNGKVFVQARDGDGTPLFAMDPLTKKTEPLLKNVTLQARPAPGTAQVMPMPSADQQASLARQQSSTMMAVSEKRAVGATQKLGLNAGVTAHLMGATLVSNLAERSTEETAVEDRQ
jgi:hypothetical protein